MKVNLVLIVLFTVFTLDKLQSQVLFVPGANGSTPGIGASLTSNVGIGISAPSTKLHLYEGSGSGTHYLKMEGVGEWATIGLQFKSPSTDMSLTTYRGMMGIMGGNVGIGTSSPASALHIASSNSKLNNNYWHQTICDNSPQTSGVGGGITFAGKKSDSPAANGLFGAIDGYKENSTSGNELGGLRLWYSNGINLVEGLRLNSYGNVLIGKTSQTGSSTRYRIDVEGPIRADEIVVNTTGADFVFEPAYKLRSLSELETFIRTNKHLPDIASAKDMQENGISAGEMQAKLLQKVEELTLYVIEKDKEIAKLKAEKDNQLAEQQKLLMELKKEIEILKNK